MFIENTKTNNNITKSAVRSLRTTESSTLEATKEDLFIKHLLKTFDTGKTKIQQYLTECLGFDYFSKRIKKTLI